MANHHQPNDRSVWAVIVRNWLLALFGTPRSAGITVFVALLLLYAAFPYTFGPVLYGVIQIAVAIFGLWLIIGIFRRKG